MMLEELITIGLIEDSEIILDEAALSLALFDYPELDDEPFWDVLSDINERMAVYEAETGPSVQAEHLANVLSAEFGFSGDRETYDDPANADLVRVLERRKGLPVSLAILYVSAARRLGWMANVLDVPGHVLVMIGGPKQPIIIDPFAGGALVSSDRLDILFGPPEVGRPATVRKLTSMPNRSVLVRLLMNQAIRADEGGDAERALDLYQRMTLIAPSHSHAWRECARLQMANSEYEAARDSLVAMMEVTRDPKARKQITEILAAMPRADG